MNPKEKMIAKIQDAMNEFQKETGVYVEVIKVSYMRENEISNKDRVLVIMGIDIDYT